MTDEQTQDLWQPSAEEILQQVQMRAPAVVELAVQDCYIRHLRADNDQLRMQLPGATVPAQFDGVGGSTVLRAPTDSYKPEGVPADALPSEG